MTYQGAISDDISAEIEDSEGHRVRDVTTMTQNGVKQIHFTPSQAGTFRVKAFLRDEEVKGRSLGDGELRSHQTPSTGRKVGHLEMVNLDRTKLQAPVER